MEEILTATNRQLIELMGTREIQHNADLNRCNNRLSAIMEWKVRMVEMYTPPAP